MTTRTKERTIEELVRLAEKASEDGERVGSILDKGSDNSPPMEVSTMESAGEVFIYDTKTAERSKINRNMLTVKLKQKRADDSFVFTTQQPSFSPKRGTYKCFLHPSDPNRSKYDSYGFGRCSKSNLTSPMQVELHMQHCHRTEWKTIQREKEELEKQQDRNLRELLLKGNVPKKDFLCETCKKTFSTKLALAGHSRSHKK